MKKNLCFLLALCVILSMTMLGTTSVMADETQYSDEIVKAAQRALDRVEVENVISKHEYYHSALNHLGEFLEIWVDEDPWMETMSWTNNTQKMVGAYNLYGFMVTDLVSNITNSLGSAQNNDDQGIIQDDGTWYGTGMFWYHMLMSPMIIVADDGQTARGCFQSFGTVTGPMGDLCAQWTCESYGFDCAKMSDGEWKIWHLHTYVYFYVDTTSTWAYQNTSSSSPSGVNVVSSLLPTGASLTNTTEDASASSEVPADLTPPNGDMTPPNGDMTPPEQGGGTAAVTTTETASVEPIASASGEASGGASGEASGAPGDGGMYAQADYEVIQGTYFTNYNIYKVPESVPMPYAYSTWAEVEANGDGY